MKPFLGLFLAFSVFFNSNVTLAAAQLTDKSEAQRANAEEIQILTQMSGEIQNLLAQIKVQKNKIALGEKVLKVSFLITVGGVIATIIGHRMQWSVYSVSSISKMYNIGGKIFGAGLLTTLAAASTATVDGIYLVIEQGDLSVLESKLLIAQSKAVLEIYEQVKNQLVLE